MAAEAGSALDLHTDETLEPGDAGVGGPRRACRRHRLPPSRRRPATACRLAVQSEHRQREVAEKVAAAGISVIALPHTNLFLQGRELQVAMPRAVTAVKALRAAGRQRRRGRRQPAGSVQPGRPWRPARDRRADDHGGPRAAGRRAGRWSRGAARTAMGLGPSAGSRGGSSRDRPRGDRLRPGRSRWSSVTVRDSGNRAFTRSAAEPSGSLPYTPSHMGTQPGPARRTACPDHRARPVASAPRSPPRSAARVPSSPWSTSTSSG